MPSPFPGMDPYLEAPAIWPGVRAALLNAIREILVPEVRPNYYVDLERRVYVVEEDDPAQRLLVPDVTVVAAPGRGAPQPQATAGARAMPAVVLMVQEQLEVRESRLVIHAADNHEVVCVIELLSPANKTTGSKGRDEYLSKRRELLRSTAHLVEVDLLRVGNRIPSVGPLPEGDYYVHVSRVALRPRGEVFAWTLRDAAPAIPVPLRRRDPDAIVDLAEVIGRAYDRGGYDLIVDYLHLPGPPLRPSDEAWAQALLAQRRGPRDAPADQRERP